MHTASLAEVGATNRPTTDTIEATFSALQRRNIKTTVIPVLLQWLQRSNSWPGIPKTGSS